MGAAFRHSRVDERRTWGLWEEHVIFHQRWRQDRGPTPVQGLPNGVSRRTIGVHARCSLTSFSIEPSDLPCFED